MPPASPPQPIKWRLVSRALTRHEPWTAYTLLREGLPEGAAGEALLALTRTVHDWPRSASVHEIRDSTETLSRRELQVLQCAARGLTVVDTAREMIVAPETVKHHRKGIMLRLDADSIGEAVSTARQLGLIT